MTGKLSERAMLACLHVGVWSGNLHDKDITDEISTQHNAESRAAGRYIKQIISRKFLAHVGELVTSP